MPEPRDSVLGQRDRPPSRSLLAPARGRFAPASEVPCDTRPDRPYHSSHMANGTVALSRAWTWVLPAREADWDAWYAEQLPRIYNFFRFRVGDGPVAEDLTSLTFEKAWSAKDRYRRDLGAFGTWLYAIARNVAADHFRQQRAHVPIDD